MYTLGILALLQMIALPGLLIQKLLQIKEESIIKFFVNSFVISLLFNFFLVFILTNLGLYLRSVVISLVIVEIIWLTYLNKNLFLKKIDLQHFFQKYFLDIFQDKSSIKVISLLILMSINILILIRFSQNIHNDFFNIFRGWDALVSWNRWALEWSNNSLPTATLNYPQLLPANWSLSYVLVGTPYQFFSRGLMPFFPLVMLLFTFSVFLKHRQLLFGICLISIYKFFYLMDSQGMRDGFADMPVACLAFLSVLYLFAAKLEKDEKDIVKNLYFGAIAVVVTVLTKQAGIYILLPYSLLSYFIVLKVKFESQSERFRILKNMIILILCLLIPWYFYNSMLILMGKNGYEFNGIFNQMHNGREFWDRILYGFQILERQISHPILKTCLLFFFVLSFASKDMALINICITVPCFVFWSLFNSYDMRNLSLSFHLFALALGYGINFFIMQLIVPISSFFLNRLKVFHFVGMAVLLLCFLQYRYKNSTLKEIGTNLELTLGDNELNRTLLELIQKDKSNLVIYSSTIEPMIISSIKDNSIYMSLHSSSKPEIITKKILQKQNKSILFSVPKSAIEIITYFEDKTIVPYLEKYKELTHMVLYRKIDIMPGLNIYKYFYQAILSARPDFPSSCVKKPFLIEDKIPYQERLLSQNF